MPDEHKDTPVSCGDLQKRCVQLEELARDYDTFIEHFCLATARHMRKLAPLRKRAKALGITSETVIEDGA